MPSNVSDPVMQANHRYGKCPVLPWRCPLSSLKKIKVNFPARVQQKSGTSMAMCIGPIQNNASALGGLRAFDLERCVF